MKNTHSTTKHTKIKLALLMAVVIAVALTLAACKMTNHAVSEDDYSFVLSDTTPTEITYEQGEQASPLTITLTFDEGQSYGIYYVRWLEIYDDSVNTGVMEQFVYKLRITEDDGEVVQLPSFPNNTPVEFTYTPSTSEVGTKHYVLEAEYKYQAAVNVGNICNSVESSRTHTERLRSEVIAVTVTDPNAPPVNNGDDDDALTLEITSEPQSANYTQNASDVSALSVEISTNASAEDVTYAWYSNTENSTTGGTAVSGANSANYMPSTATEGTFYYYCTVTAKNDSEEKTATSAVAIIKVGNTQQLSQTEYNFAITSQPTGGTYTAGSTATLSVAAQTNSGNTLTYQWFTSLTASVEGAVAITGATYPSFNVNTSNNSNQYYYCRVTDIYEGQTHVRNSNIANVVVTGANPTPTPTPTPIADEVWVKGVLVTAANAGDVFADGGSVKYNFATKTLTLDNAMLEYSSSSLSADSYKNAVIGANTDLIVELVNNNNIGYYLPSSGGTPTATAAISVSGSLTFSGSGNLVARAPYISHGFDVGNNLNINGTGSVTATGGGGGMQTGSNGYNGANVGGTLTVGSSASFTATGGGGGSGIEATSTASAGKGGTGGSGVAAAAVIVDPSGTLTATGGGGGYGGTGFVVGGNYTGGNGGTGGTGVDAATVTVGSSATFTVTGGEGGAGGSGSSGSNGGDGGTGVESTVVNASTGTATGGDGGVGFGGTGGTGGYGAKINGTDYAQGSGRDGGVHTFS